MATPKLAASLVLTALALSACIPGSAQPDSGPTSVTEARTGVPGGISDLSLVSTPEAGAAIRHIIVAFEAAHSNVNIKYSESSFDDYNKSLNLNLASERSPDIVLLNFIGTTVRDRLVVSLEPYAKAYGWEKSYPSSQLNQWRVAPDGSTLGVGDLYAAPAGFDFVGLYYNKSKAARLGITMPMKSLAEFESALAKAQAAGELPLQLGNKEGHASFPLQLIGQSHDGPAAYAEWTFGRKGSSFDTPGNKLGAGKLREWARKGYVPAGANSVDLQSAVAEFNKGEGVFLIDGSWDSQVISAALRSEVGFVPFPAQKATAIGTSLAYGISAKSEHQQAAAAFLDFMRTPEAVKISFVHGQMPSNTDAVAVQSGDIRTELVAAWTKINADNGLIGYNNNATATMNDTLTTETQKLIAGRQGVDGFVKTVQDDWNQTHG
ncbi:extracellular solute-binding protein [Streptomyces sp. NPDC005389]|uniref:ABC transporter substrate-binding protein n=1 Tax=Streptomyces sp. NPDC005389 TaxID=3157040 RepID=UPI0033B6B0CD